MEYGISKTDWPDKGAVEQRSNLLHSTSPFFIVIIQSQS